MWLRSRIFCVILCQRRILIQEDIACTVYNTLTGKKSQSQKDVDQQIKEATQKVAADTKISLKLDQIGYDVKSIPLAVSSARTL